MVIYGKLSVVLSVSAVKPAVFDLLLASGIAAYLFVVYHAVLVSPGQ